MLTDDGLWEHVKNRLSMDHRAVAATLVALVVWVACVGRELCAQPARQLPTYPPRLEGAREFVYKRVGDVELRMYVFFPSGENPAVKRAAIVFFFGGGWNTGSVTQFQSQCMYLARRGMVAMAADYRVASRHGVRVVECIADAKSAIRWVRREADRLGVDPQRVVAAGGSAGGHLAAATALVPGCDEPGEDQTVSCRPNALVLFNPALILAPLADEPAANIGRLDAIAARFGAPPEAVSPYHHIRQTPALPPTLILHGTADTTVPYRSAELFAQAMQKAGATCDLIGYANQPHGFFNYGRANNRYYHETLQAVDKFLTDLGFLPRLTE